MTTKQLRNKIISIRQSGYGHWQITVEKYGKEYTHTTTNSQAVDRVNFADNYNDRQEHGNYTYKQALAALYYK